MDGYSYEEVQAQLVEHRTVINQHLSQQGSQLIQIYFQFFFMNRSIFHFSGQTINRRVESLSMLTLRYYFIYYNLY